LPLSGCSTESHYVRWYNSCCYCCCLNWPQQANSVQYVHLCWMRSLCVPNGVSSTLKLALLLSRAETNIYTTPVNHSCISIIYTALPLGVPATLQWFSLSTGIGATRTICLSHRLWCTCLHEVFLLTTCLARAEWPPGVMHWTHILSLASWGETHLPSMMWQSMLFQLDMKGKLSPSQLASLTTEYHRTYGALAGSCQGTQELYLHSCTVWWWWGSCSDVTQPCLIGLALGCLSVLPYLCDGRLEYLITVKHLEQSLDTTCHVCIEVAQMILVELLYYYQDQKNSKCGAKITLWVLSDAWLRARFINVDQAWTEFKFDPDLGLAVIFVAPTQFRSNHELNSL